MASLESDLNQNTGSLILYAFKEFIGFELFS